MKLNLGHIDKSEKKIAVEVYVLWTTQNLVISRCYKCTKNYNARAQLLFYSLILLFSDAAVAIAVFIFFIIN